MILIMINCLLMLSLNGILFSVKHLIMISKLNFSNFVLDLDFRIRF